MRKLLALAVLTALTALAGELAGTWTGTAVAQNGQGDSENIPVTMILKKTADGKMEGTTQAGDEQTAMPISAFSSNGNKVYFEIKFENDNGPAVIQVNLEHEGDKLTGEFTRVSGGEKRGGKVSFTKKT